MVHVPDRGLLDPLLDSSLEVPELLAGALSEPQKLGSRVVVSGACTRKARPRVSAFIGFGSNLGDPRSAIEEAVKLLEAVPEVALVALSNLMRSAPVGGPAGQEDFLNGVAHIETALSPQQLLCHLLRIELHLGRIRIARWGPRIIDLDILSYGNLVLREPGLCIPHPRMVDRDFVLEPLRQVAPDWVHPVSGISVDLLARQVAVVSLREQTTG